MDSITGPSALPLGVRSVASQTVGPPRVLECPVQLEATVEAVHDLAEHDEVLRGGAQVFEVRIQRVHVDESILMEKQENRIDSDKWNPLIMSFQKFYGLDSGQQHASTLATIPESMYRSPDVDRARG